MKKLYFLSAFLISLALFPQESESKLLRGKIVFSSMNQSSINIINLTKNSGTTNNEDGEFEIEVDLGDELLFSSVQYLPYRIIVDKEILEMELMIVELTPSVTRLEQVRISNIDLSGNLVTDANSVDGKLLYTNQSLGFPPASPAVSIETRRIYASTSEFLGGLVNLISGRLKHMKKLEQAARLRNLVEKAARSMEEDFFLEECKIPEKYLISFMYFCSEDEYFENLVQADQKLDLVGFFKQKAIEYKKMKGLN